MVDAYRHNSLLANTPLELLTLHLPDGIARPASGLAGDSFSSTDTTDTTLDPGCTLSAIGTCGSNSKQPLIIKSSVVMRHGGLGSKSVSFEDTVTESLKNITIDVSKIRKAIGPVVESFARKYYYTSENETQNDKRDPKFRAKLFQYYYPERNHADFRQNLRAYFYKAAIFL